MEPTYIRNGPASGGRHRPDYGQPEYRTRKWFQSCDWDCTLQDLTRILWYNGVLAPRQASWDNQQELRHDFGDPHRGGLPSSDYLRLAGWGRGGLGPQHCHWWTLYPCTAFQYTSNTKHCSLLVCLCLFKCYVCFMHRFRLVLFIILIATAWAKTNIYSGVIIRWIAKVQGTTNIFLRQWCCWSGLQSIYR